MKRWRSKWIGVAVLVLSSGLLRSQDAVEAPLEVGAARTGVLGPGERHGFAAVLGKGEYIKVVAQQKGVDLVLTVLDPDRFKLAEVDSPNGAFGPEPWAGEIPKAGRYLFEVSAPDPKSKPGTYEIRMAVRLAADEYAAHRIVPLEPGVLDRLRGNFEVAPGRVLFVGLMAGIFTAGGKDILYYRDSETRRTGPLYPASATRFFSGPDLGDPYPPEVDPFRCEPVAFESGGATLRGYVLVPEGRGPFPAVLHVNGSQGSRTDVGPAGNFFVRQGFAFMAFDKRGAGKSTGRWQEATRTTRSWCSLPPTTAFWSAPRGFGPRCGRASATCPATGKPWPIG